MIALWYAIISFMLIVYIALDGRNFGVGMLHWLVARTPEERRQVIAAIGPLWLWHEVWLVVFGGTLVAVFPHLMASAFAGYYLALFLILWGLILRGVSIEVGGHINDRLWQGFWDFVFVFSNFLLAVLFGVAAGNVARGVPLDGDGNFSMPFFTNFSVRGQVGLIDWYTISIAIFAAVILAAHGGAHLTLKTEGSVHDRSFKYTKYLWAMTLPLFLVISVESHAVRPDAFERATQPVLLARDNGNRDRGLRFDFRHRGSPRTADVLGIEFYPDRLADYWGCRHFPGHALFDFGGREFDDCLFCRCDRELVAPGPDLVAPRFSSGSRLFRLHLATLWGEGHC